MVEPLQEGFFASKGDGDFILRVENQKTAIVFIYPADMKKIDQIGLVWPEEAGFGKDFFKKNNTLGYHDVFACGVEKGGVAVVVFRLGQMVHDYLARKLF